MKLLFSYFIYDYVPGPHILMNLNYDQYSQAYLQLFSRSLSARMTCILSKRTARIRALYLYLWCASYLNVLHVYVHVIKHVIYALYYHHARSIFQSALSSYTYHKLFTALMEEASSSTFYPHAHTWMALWSWLYKPLYPFKNNHYDNKEDTTKNYVFLQTNHGCNHRLRSQLRQYWFQ